eukprot:3200-Heterococcus_DN1.PRE.1
MPQCRRALFVVQSDCAFTALRPSLQDFGLMVGKPVRFAVWVSLAVDAGGTYLVHAQLAQDKRICLYFRPCNVRLGEQTLRVKQLAGAPDTALHRKAMQLR